MLKSLIKKTPNHFVYYIDVSLEETLLRHKSKTNSHEFGEKEIRSWYKDKDLLEVEGEKVIEEKSNLLNTVQRIIKEASL